MFFSLLSMFFIFDFQSDKRLDTVLTPWADAFRSANLIIISLTAKQIISKPPLLRFVKFFAL